MNSELTSLWAYLEKHRIAIPLIQRDYAQGREGKSALRKRFLKSLKQALTSNQPLLLDFVYGDSCRDDIHPIDGQQRLTTLWLLHWYIAMRAGYLNDATTKSRLQKFSYETRTSSREFCEKLIDWKPQAPTDLKKQIGDQTWFRAEWKQDPTIDAMLRMLSGENGEPDDCIEKGFGEKQLNTYRSWWFSMIGNCFQFYSLDMGTMENVDDLYVKMNARGEQLTDFENFKADLIGYIQKQAEQQNPDDWESFNDARNGIAIKMDTAWTDIFWQQRQDGRIDELYFAFINQVWRSALIVAGDIEGYLMSEEDIQKTVLFQLPDKYEDFDIYENPGRPLDVKNILILLRQTLDNIKSYVTLCALSKDISTSPSWDNRQNVYLIPRYNEGNVIFSNGNVGGEKERLIHFALCKFFENNQLNDTAQTQFNDWMRVAWNIVENSTATEIGTMRLLNELGKNANNILDFLANPSSSISSGAAKEQVEEEIAKARLIYNGGTRSNDWNQAIREAESYEYLKGSISVLFSADYRDNTIEKLDQRLKLLENLVNDKTDDYKLIKVLISHLNNAYDLGNNIIPLVKRFETWKQVIVKFFKDVFRDITDDSVQVQVSDQAPQWIQMLANSKLLNQPRGEKILKKYGNKIILYATRKHNWNAYGNVVLDEFHTLPALSTLISGEEIQNAKPIEGTNIFAEWDVFFNKDGQSFMIACGGQLWKKNDSGEWNETENSVNKDTSEDTLRDFIK